MKAATTLRPLLDARSVAIVGAVPARDHAKLASKPILNLQKYGFGGEIYPVNPKFDEIAGLAAYPSLRSIPGPVDCVMMLRHADHVVPGLEEMADLGIPAAVVCSSGFAEIGGEGTERQRRLVRIADDFGIAVCGPNTNGLLNFRNGMMLGFHPLLEQPRIVEAGGVSVVSHSGTVTGAVMARLETAGVGFGYVVSAGNEATVQAADYMTYLAGDEGTEVVVLYLEQVRDPRAFLAAASLLKDAGKTVIALKAGASTAGAEVAFGHTGALVGSHTAFAAAARAHGVVVCDGLEDLVAATKTASTSAQVDASIIGISMSGGLNGLMADSASRAGVGFEPLTDATRTRLREIVPIGTPTNPFDITGLAVDNPGVLDAVLDTLASGSRTRDLVFSLGLMPDATWPDWSRVCREVADRHGMRIWVYAASGRRDGDGYEQFERLGIPVFDAIDPLLTAIATLAAGRASVAREKASAPAVTPLPEDVPGRRELLTESGLDYVPYAFVSTREEAVRAADDMGYPVAMKVASEDIAHKAKLGLIELDVHSADAAGAAFERLAANYDEVRAAQPGLAPLRVEIQRMLPRGGMEVFLGARVDPEFGTIVSVGPGGGLVEAFAALSSAVAPADEAAASELLRANPILHRALSTGRWDEAALTTAVLRFSRMAAARSHQLEEVECNPIVVYASSAWIVDDLWQPKRGEGTR